MKICYVHEEYPLETNFGGIATYQKIMAEELVKLNNKITVIARSLTCDQDYYENGVHVYRVFVEQTNDRVADFWKYREKVCSILIELQNSGDIDLIETPDWGAETYCFEKFRNVPLVVRMHTPLKVWLKYNKNNFGDTKNILLDAESKMLLYANGITCCSNVLKKVIEEEFELNDNKIIVTPNPANIIDFYRDDNIEKEKRIIFAGSLEERKGIVVLAKALNVFFEKFPFVKVDFVGKDTNRNYLNISSVELIKKIVSSKYHDNLFFHGQVDNVDLNSFYNKSLMAVFPSLFDNFPYVVLESMHTGLHVIGSSNSGMVEMINDDNYIYDTGDHTNLSKKMIETFDRALLVNINDKNVKRVDKFYNSRKIATDILKYYNDIISKFNEFDISKSDLNYVLSTITKSEIIDCDRINDGVANVVYKVCTANNKYVVKKYYYNYDFDLMLELYKLYSNLSICKPINDKIIYYKGYKYNVFEYVEHGVMDNSIDVEYLLNLIKTKRNTLRKNTLHQKYIKYFNHMLNNPHLFKIDKSIINFVLKLSKELIDNNIFNETYLNHGDISKSNIIISKDQFYLLDFDEACVTTKLYDFAVVIVKFFCEPNLDKERYCYMVNDLKKHFKVYKYEDFKNVLKYYLCKIILEKFYFYSIGKIDLFDSNQLSDNFMKYVHLLKYVEKNI